MAKKRALRQAGGIKIEESEISPLSLFSIVLSVAALCNAQSRWLFANLDELRESGGYAAATDLQIVADVLTAMVEDNLDEWLKYTVRMPPGFAHVPWSVKMVTDEEKGDLPF